MTSASKPVEVRTDSWTQIFGREIYVCGVGARTPLGMNLPASAAAVRGAISALSEHPHWKDTYGQPVCLNCDAAMDADLALETRFELLLQSALNKVLGDESSQPDLDVVPVCIGLPSARPGLSEGIADKMIAAATRSLSPISARLSVIEHGHAAALMAIQSAAQDIASGKEEIFLVAGVDSYCNRVTIEWLDKIGALSTSENRNGFPPGEAAATCLLASKDAAERYRLPLLAKIRAVSTAIEPHSIRSDEVCLGVGLTAAIRGAVSSLALPIQAVTDTYCDLNGERYRNEEFLYALMRTQESFADAHDQKCPADCWGDVGAASGTLFVALAIMAASRNYAKGSYAVLWTSSEDGYRCAALLELPGHHDRDGR